MPSVEHSLRSDERPRIARDGACDVERAAAAFAEALVAVSVTPAFFTILAIGSLIGIAMYRLMIV